MSAEGDLPLEAPLPVGVPGPTGPEFQPLQPLPMKKSPASGGKPALEEHPPYAPPPRPGSQGGRAAPTAKARSSNGSPEKAYDLGSMNLKTLGGATAQAPAEMPRLTSPVVPASHKQAEPAPAKAAAESPVAWKSAHQSASAEEPSASRSSAPATSSTSGWKSVHRPRSEP
jgi:hypothetical protein